MGDEQERVIARLDAIIDLLAAIKSLLEPPAAVPSEDPVKAVEKAQTAADLRFIPKAGR